MAVPVAAMAAKAVAGWFQQKVKEGKAPAIVGGIVAALVFGLLVPVVMLSSIIGGFVAAGSGDPCQMANAGFSVNGEAVRIMSWNVCGKSCGGWNRRGPLAAKEVAAQSPDILAITEGGHDASVRGMTFKSFQSAGLKNATPKGPFGGQYIFYNPQAFSQLRSGHFSVTRSYGTTWVELRNNTSGAKFIMTATHIQYKRGVHWENIRGAQMRTLVGKVKGINKGDLPIIWAGDFNAAKENRNHAVPIGMMINSGYNDAQDIAATKINRNRSTTLDAGTHTRVRHGRPIDHIFVPKGMGVSYWENIIHQKNNKHTGPFITDHHPIIASVGLPGGNASGGAVSASARSDIPQVALEAYQKAAGATGVPWQYIAAIGKVETNHGRYRGSKPNAKGDVRPKIRNSIGASGPMQFMPPTWGQYKQDANFDGVKSVDNIYDAAAATARMLKRNGAPSNMRSAIFSYNHAGWYVDKVIAQAKKYSGGSSSKAAQATVGTVVAQQTATVAISAVANLVMANTSSSWVRPVKTGGIGTKFGVAGGMWSSGYHTGVDFRAPMGTPVFAAQTGTVSVSHPGWAGNLITINHGNLDGKNIKTQYAHLSRVVKKSGMVQAGDLIAYSGALGNVTGPHLHFEVLVNGKYANPESYLSGAGTPIFVGDMGAADAECGDFTTEGDEDQNTADNGHTNGKVPVSTLCAVTGVSGGLLRCDAARSLNSLNADYKKKFGKKMPITVTYRDLTAQAACKATNPDCDATGKSRYGFGLVVKFGNPLSSKASAQYKWMKYVGVSQGWIETAGAWEFNKKA